MRDALTVRRGPRLEGRPKTQLQGVFRVFEMTLFQYVVRRLPEQLQEIWKALKSGQKSLQGFCRCIVPNPAERKYLFARLSVEAGGEDPAWHAYGNSYYEFDE